MMSVVTTPSSALGSSFFRRDDGANPATDEEPGKRGLTNAGGRGEQRKNGGKERSASERQGFVHRRRTMGMNLRRPNFLGWMNDAVRAKSQKKFVAALN